MSAKIIARVIAAVILIALPLTLLEKYSAAGCRTFASLKALHDIKYHGNEIDEVRWLSYKEGWLYCENDRFQYYDKNVENIISELEIPQENGIDKVDRITYFLENPL